MTFEMGFYLFFFFRNSKFRIFFFFTHMEKRGGHDYNGTGSGLKKERNVSDSREKYGSLLIKNSGMKSQAPEWTSVPQE